MVSIESVNISDRRILPPKAKWKNYLSIILLANAFAWGTVLIYTSRAKTAYISDWSITIPGAGSSSSINLPNIGQAVSQNMSAYAGASFDPRENYKAIAESEEVLKTAAKAVNMASQEFGKPRIKILDNTTMMTFELKGANPGEAQKKSLALYSALEVRLNQLRNEEVVQQNQRLQSGIEDLRGKLKTSQQYLSQYKASSGLSSSDQINNLATNIESLRKQRAELVAQQQQSSARLTQLSANLGLSPQQAADAFFLQTDPVFQKYLQNYSEANANLLALSAKFLAEHPTVVSERLKRDNAEAAVVSRAESLLKRSFNIASVDKLNFSGATGSSRAMLSQQMVATQGDMQGLTAQAQELEQQIHQLESRLKILSQQESKLEDLKRDVQVAEAVFSSSIAKLDLGKSSISASYPQIQVLSQPSLPEESAGPKKNLLLLGATLGSLFCTSGILTLWRRDRSQVGGSQRDVILSHHHGASLEENSSQLQLRDNLIQSIYSDHLNRHIETPIAENANRPQKTQING
jgi:uncharacterized protein involved in exopolysaccharide biosynthesis